jgi:phosphatidylglycerol lysyltransferase
MAYFRWRQTGMLLLIAAAVGVATWVLERQWGDISLQQLLRVVAAMPQWRIGVSVGLTTASFAALASYDAVAAAVVVPRRVPLIVAMFAGAAANAVSNTLGFHAVTSSAVRYRIYRRWSLGLPDVARMIYLSWTALALGFLTALAFAFILTQQPPAAGTFLQWPIPAISLLVLLGSFLTWLSRGSRTLGYGRFSLAFPTARIAIVQMLVGAVETVATVAALYVLIPPAFAPPFALFEVGFIGAVMLGILSHAPGGIGVFEATMIVLFPRGQSEMLPALLLFRVIYNFLPFILAVAALGAFELTARKTIQFDGG